MSNNMRVTRAQALEAVGFLVKAAGVDHSKSADTLRRYINEDQRRGMAEVVTPATLSTVLGVKSSAVLRELLRGGRSVTLNQPLAEDEIAYLVQEGVDREAHKPPNEVSADERKLLATVPYSIQESLSH